MKVWEGGQPALGEQDGQREIGGAGDLPPLRIPDICRRAATVVGTIAVRRYNTGKPSDVTTPLSDVTTPLSDVTTPKSAPFFDFPATPRNEHLPRIHCKTPKTKPQRLQSNVQTVGTESFCYPGTVWPSPSYRAPQDAEYREPITARIKEIRGPRMGLGR